MPWKKVGKGLNSDYLELPQELVHSFESNLLHMNSLCTTAKCKVHTHPDSRLLCPMIRAGIAAGIPS